MPSTRRPAAPTPPRDDRSRRRRVPAALGTTASPHQRQVHGIDDLDEDVVGGGGDPAHDKLVAQQHDGHGGDAWMKRLGGRLTTRYRASEDGQPKSGLI